MPGEERVDVVCRGRARGDEPAGHRLARHVAGEHRDAIAPVHLLRDLDGEALRAGEALAEHRATGIDDDHLVARLRLGPLREASGGARSRRTDRCRWCRPPSSAFRAVRARRRDGGDDGRRRYAQTVASVARSSSPYSIARSPDGVNAVIVAGEPLGAAFALLVELVAARAHAGSSRRGRAPARRRRTVDRELARGALRQRIDVAAHARDGRDGLGVRDDDAPRAVLRDREDLELEATAALPLEERRIVPRAGHPDDLLLRLRRLRRGVLDRAAPDRRGLRLVDELAVDELAVDLEREPLDLRAGRQREAVDALELVVRVVRERLVDLGARDVAGDADLHARASRDGPRGPSRRFGRDDARAARRGRSRPPRCPRCAS